MIFRVFIGAREKSRKFKRKMALFSVNVKQAAFL